MTPNKGEPPQDADSERKRDRSNEKVGPYRIQRLLGRGGNGSVYLALRRDPHQQVAIKFLNLGDGDNEEFRRRFLREKQILAFLSHPFIVKLFDVDKTRDGCPYFVMEYVDGQSVDEHANTKRLNIRARLALMLKICTAVEYLHSSLLLHRDLKPANILAGPDGDPKILDFGIAKLLRPELLDGEMVTKVPVHPLTIEYASPEQWRGDALTTASDVYSLGVICYQLLTGRLPVAWAEEQNTLTYMQAVCTGNVPAASRNVAPGHFKACREDSEKALIEQLRGDLDAILEKALNTDLPERYQTVAAFSQDIDRHLQFLPVGARKGLASYRVRRFLRRNTGWVLSVAAVVTALSIGLTTTTWQRDRANRERAHAEEIAGQQSMLAGKLQQQVASLRNSANDFQLESDGLRTALKEAADSLQRSIPRTTRGDDERDPAKHAWLGQTYGVLGRMRTLSGETQAARQAYETCLVFLSLAEQEGDRFASTANARRQCLTGLAQLNSK